MCKLIYGTESCHTKLWRAHKKEERITKWHKETSGGDGYAYYFDLDAGFIGLCVSKLIKLSSFKYVLFIVG